MDSALTPREIQARIRSGQTLDEVARAAGVPVEKVEPFAVPVLAERQHVVGTALSASVRRRGEATGHRTLRQIIAERLEAHGIDIDSVEWDSWRNADRRWSVKASFLEEDNVREAIFLYDLAGRFSVSHNDDARWVLGEIPSPTQREADNDQLAIVRAVSDEREAQASEPAPVALTPVPTAESEGDPADQEPTTPIETEPASAASPQDIADEVEAELDAFDVIPEGHSELDMLYDMLGGIAEDSINIYAGLEQPVVDDSPATDEPPAVEAEPEPAAEDPATKEPAQAIEPAEPVQPSLEEELLPADTDAEASQEPEPTPEPEAPTKPARRTRKKRASVPSWDEIMFGGPSKQ